MQIPFDQFSDRIRSCKELHSLYYHLKQTLALPNDLTDLLRAEIVNSVSAFDRFMHDMIRIGMIDIFNERRTQTNKFKTFTVSVEALINIQQAIKNNLTYTVVPTPEYWFEQEIILRHKIISFQEPEKISDGLSYIWDENHKWQKISCLISIDEKVIKTTLKTIINRKNQIVHEADIDLQTGTRHDIEEADATETVDFLFKLGESIFNCINSGQNSGGQNS